MPTLTPFLLFCQALGAAVGAFTALWGEFAYIRAARDGKIDRAERAHLDVIAHGLRYGMILLLLSSLGLIVAAYQAHAAPQPALTASYWTLIALSVLIVAVTWALSRGHLSSIFGSATVFTAWWFLSYLTIGWLAPFTFASAVVVLVVSTAVIYALFYYLRLISVKTK